MNIKDIDCKCPYCEKNFQLGEAVQEGALERILSVASRMKEGEIQSAIEREKKKALEEGKSIAQKLAFTQLGKKEQELKQLENRIKEKELKDLEKDSLIASLQGDQTNTIQIALAREKQQIQDEAFKDVQKKQKELIKLQGLLREKELKDLEKDSLIVSLKDSQESIVQIALAKQQSSYQEEKKKMQAESDLKISRLQEDMDKMSKKMDSKSGEVQGEAGEISIENTLRDIFPNDDVREIPKGQEGADCILIVKNKSSRQVGKILFESKNTEHFYEKWIDKLKQDANREKADLSILVTKKCLMITRKHIFVEEYGFVDFMSILF